MHEITSAARTDESEQLPWTVISSHFCIKHVQLQKSYLDYFSIILKGTLQPEDN